MTVVTVVRAVLIHVEIVSAIAVQTVVTVAEIAFQMACIIV